MRHRYLPLVAVILAVFFPLSLRAAEITSAEAATIPDVVVTANNLSVNKTAIKSGDSVTFKAIVKNIGTDTARNFKVHLYLDGTEIYTKTISSLSKNITNTVSKTYIIPAGVGGNMIFSAVIDPEQTLLEGNENNNRAEMAVQVRITQPDLSVSADDLSINKTLISRGDSVMFKAVIKNTGTAPGKNFKVRLMLDKTEIYSKSITTLNSGSNVTVSKLYTIPQDSKNEILFNVVIDTDASVREIDKINNQAEKIYQLSELIPDLAITAGDLSINKTTVAGGDAVTFKAKISNNGTLVAKNFKVIFYFGETEVYQKTITTLNKNATTNVTKLFSIPTDISGDMPFKVVIDSEEKIAELNEKNNEAEKIITVNKVAPDLSIVTDDLSVNKTSIKGGDTVYLKAKVKNLGTAKAQNIKINLLLNDTVIFTKTLSVLYKNGNSMVGISYKIPTNLQGNVTFKATVDPEEKIAELNEKNNEAEKIIKINPAQIDLTIDNFIGSPSKPKVGQQENFTIKIKNIGNTAADNVKVLLFADNNSQNPTATFTINKINPNATASRTIKWTIPANINQAIGYTVRAVIDPDNEIFETNENNNIKTYTFNLTAPDLKIITHEYTHLTGPIYPNTRIAQWVRVTNDNILAVNNVKIGLYYYLNNNSASITKIDEENLGTMAKKANREVYLDGALPSNIPLGTTIHLIAKIDASNQIAETDETNNELAAARIMTERPRQVQYPYLRVYVNDDNGNPFNGANVKITNKSTGAIETKVTGSESFYLSTGNVIFESRPNTANYTIEVSAPGFRTATQDLAYDKSIDNTNDTQIHLDKKTLVTGKVSNTYGAPLSYVKVRIEGTGLETITDAQGKYGFLLNGGNYNFRFIKAGYNRLSENNKTIAPLSNIVMDKTMAAGTVGYISGTITDDEGTRLQNVDVWVNGNPIGYTGAQGTFNFTLTAGNKNIKIKKPGYVTVEFNQVIEAGEEYDFNMSMSKPSTDTHVERGTTFVSWHQHEGTPANAFFIPEYNVDVWWGTGHVKMGLDFNKTDSATKITKLTVNVRGDNWECHRVQGDADVETSAIDIPITISAGGCFDALTQINVSKVAIYSNGVEVWSDDTNWTTATDPINSQAHAYTLDNLNVDWNNNLQIKMWARVLKRSAFGIDGDGSGALYGYHLDKKLITWYPQKPPTSSVSTSWGQVGGYFLGILDNPVNIVAGFTDLYTVEEFNQYDMEEVLSQNYPD